MAWTNKTKHLRTKELISKKRFFRIYAKQAGLDIETVQVHYFSLMLVIAEELGKHKFVRLPYLGDLALVEQKARHGLAGKHAVMMPPKDILRFYPKNRLQPEMVHYRTQRETFRKKAELLFSTG
jgi:nucleoid DNA-binding protein